MCVEEEVDIILGIGKWRDHDRCVNISVEKESRISCATNADGHRAKVEYKTIVDFSLFLFLGRV